MGSFELLKDVLIKLCRDVWFTLDHESGLESTVCKALILEPEIFDKILYKNGILVVTGQGKREFSWNKLEEFKTLFGDDPQLSWSRKKAKLLDGKYKTLIMIQLRDKQQSEFPRDSQTLDRALAARLRKFASSVTLPETDLLATSHSGVHTHE